MRSSIIAVGAFLIATAAAQPHGKHLHRHELLHAKRDNVAVVTDIVEVYETVLLTATVWVDEDGNTISPVATGTSTGRGGAYTTVKPGIFNEPASVEAPAPVETPTPAETPAPVETPAPTPTPSTKTVQVATVPQAPSSAVAPVAPAVVNAPAAVAPEPSTAPAPVPVASTQPEAPSSSAASGSPSGDCSSGSPCSGDITFYEAGLGACGETTDGETDNVVALPWAFMGTQSNGNPFCGKTITISKGGKTVQATVVDKCMGCVGRDLDLSNKAFQDLGVDFSVGRTTADWWFN